MGISGASGAIYGIRLLQVLQAGPDVEVDLIVTEAGAKTIEYETDWTLVDVEALAQRVYRNEDIAAAPASGSYLRDGMVILPCSVKTMSALAHSYSNNLLVRAGDVTLKERKPLILMVRETPLHLGHTRLMLDLTQMGAIIMPPVPAFYLRPKTIDDLINQTVGRVLDLLNIEHTLSIRWQGFEG